MDIKEYKILSSDQSGELQEVVIAHIQEGWQPLGGIAVVANPRPLPTQSIVAFYQAVVR